jgi:hypothetical protein
MFPRVIASVLAFVVFWSCLSAQEQAAPLVPSGTQEAAFQVAGKAPAGQAGGSVDDHHLDDQPVQAQAETPADYSGLLLAGPAIQAPALLMAPPRPISMATLRPPYLDAPQRPPCMAPVGA